MFPNWTPKVAFKPLASDEKDGSSVENLLPSSVEENRDELRWKSPPLYRSYRLWTALNVLLFLFSLSVLGQQAYHKYTGKHEMNSILRKTAYYSPILDQLEISPHIEQMDGSLFEPKDPSPYRNGVKPDPKVNDAWEELDSIRTFPITADEVRRLGKDPELAAKFPEEYGLGPDAYVAQLDIFHQVHCLNLLRHLAWAEYGRNETHGKKPYSDLHFIHVSHCTEVLMQNILCTANTDVLTFNWMETQDWPFPDFFINKQCYDFEAILQWQEEKALPLMMGRNFTRPEGAKQIPAPDAFYEMFGVDQNVTLHP